MTVFTGIKIEIHRVIEVHKSLEPRSFGELVQATREARGLTHKQLSELSGVKRTTIIMLEKNKADTRLSTVTRLLETLGYRLDLVDTKEQEASDGRE